MKIRKHLIAGMLAGLLALAGAACQVDDFEGDPLEDGQMDDGVQQDDTWDDGTDDGFDDGTGDDA